jgi:hypothetical protein
LAYGIFDDFQRNVLIDAAFTGKAALAFRPAAAPEAVAQAFS